MYERCVVRWVEHETMRRRERALLRAAAAMPEVQLLRSLPLKGTATELQRRCAHDVTPLLTSNTASSSSSSSSSSAVAYDSRAVQEVLEFTRLGARFDNNADGVKGSFEESSLEVVEADLHKMWHSACLAYTQLAQYADHTAAAAAEKTDDMSERERTRNAIQLPSCVLYLVLYSHTRQAYGVGRAMGRIDNLVRSMVEQEWACAPILRVVTIGIGVTSQNRTRETTQGTSEEDEVWYPRAGLYTLNATLQCLAAQTPLKKKKTKKKCEGESDAEVLLLRPKVFVLSEAWLQPRTVVALHERVACPTSFAPLHNSSSHAKAATEMHVVPGVVHDRLSEKEVEAFARYIVCRAWR